MPQFQILIPVYNAVNVIDDTLQSIWRQQFDPQNIYTTIVDFGSTDGTYQKILRYDPFHLGVYQVDKDFTENRMAAEAGRISAYTDQNGECCQILLRPGDILYPDSLDRAARDIERYCPCGIGTIIGEVDVKTRGGSVVRPTSLYGTEKIIDGSTEYMEYFAKGYRHNVMCFGGKIRCDLQLLSGQINERIWWSKCCFANFDRSVLYIPDHLGCVQERFYADELQEILFRWDSIIHFSRIFENKREKKLSWEDRSAMEQNLAHYTLWRSYLLAAKGDRRQAKECYLFSTVLFPDIRETQIYQLMGKYVMEKDRNVYPLIQTHFQMD